MQNVKVLTVLQSKQLKEKQNPYEILFTSVKIVTNSQTGHFSHGNSFSCKMEYIIRIKHKFISEINSQDKFANSYLQCEE